MKIFIRILAVIMFLCISAGMSAQHIDFKVDGISYYGYEGYNTCTVYEVDNDDDVIIPASVRYKKKNYTVDGIEYDALWENSKLRSITFQCAIKHLRGEWFDACTSLVAINVDNANAGCISVDGVLYNKDKTEILRYPPAKPGSSFTIPQTVKTIGKLAFSNCTNLENIVLHNQLREIDWWTFHGCSKLKSIRIPLSVDGIGLSAFADCVSLTNIEIDEASPYFTYSDGVLYNKDMTAIVCYPAGRTAKTYTVPKSVREIDAIVFCGNPHLTDIIIDRNNPNYVSIEGVLYDKELHTVVYCPSRKSMESFSIPKSVNKIGEFAFYAHQGKRIVIPDNIIEIDSSTFGNCQNVTELTIGKSLKYATGVDELHNLKTIRVLRTSPPEFEDGVFFDDGVCRNAILYVPKSSMKIYKKDEFWSQFKHIKALEE